MSEYEYSSKFFDLFKGNISCYNESRLPPPEEIVPGEKVKTEVFFHKEEVTEDLFAAHLAGKRGLGICPIDEESKCYYGVIDIDNYSVDYLPVIKLIYENSLPLLPFRSKSGGLQIYFFVKVPVQAKSMVAALENVIDIFGFRKTYFAGGADHVEVFPKQKKWTPGKLGSCITVPYFNYEETLSYLYDAEGKAVEIDKAVKYIGKSRSSITTLDTALDGLEYSDAPKCIQTIALSSCLGENSGRNNYLYTAAIYLKKKYSETFPEHLEEMNAALKRPLDDVELSNIINSVKNNEYLYKCHDTPCVTYCNAAVCAKREFGIGKDKGYFTGLDYGQLTRYKSTDPYYVWELKKQNDAEFKKIILKNENELIDQRLFSTMCVRELNYFPMRMLDAAWVKTVNTVLNNMVEKEVNFASDTSEGAEVKKVFFRYLTQHGEARMPYRIKIDGVYFEDDKYYFQHTGFQRYLDTCKVRIPGGTLRETLFSYGAKEDVLKYKTGTGKQVSVNCWSRECDGEMAGIKEFYQEVFSADESMITEAHELENSEEGVDINDEAMF